MSVVAVLGSAFLAYALIAGRLRGGLITPPMLFIAIGLLLATVSGFDLSFSHQGIHLIAELTLILVLFADASRIKLAVLRKDQNLPVRMLVVGLPLVILAGAVAGALLFPQWSLWEVALLAAILAPTDAALGQAVVSDLAIPVRIRQALNVESGLNDGIALPAVLAFASLASVAAGGEGEDTDWLEFASVQLVLGPLCGIAVGWAGARLVDRAASSGWLLESGQGIAILMLAILTFALAELVGGNGFIAAFVGGAVFGNTLKHECKFLYEFMETEGELLMLITFLVFGISLLPGAIDAITFEVIIYALISLTLVRMLPIAVSLLGTGLRAPSYLFLGWFGPRGLASILFVLLVLEEASVPHAHAILTVVVMTVAISALLHGLTAGPLARAYGQKVTAIDDCVEKNPVTDLPLRTGKLNRAPQAASNQMGE